MRRAVAATSIAAFALAVSTAPALAADATVADFDELEDAIDQCAHGDTITLDGPISGGAITITCDFTLDLGGTALDLEHIKVDGSSHLTITDSGADGELNVTEPGFGNAAIEVEGDASVTINGGTITAAGGNDGAGIGSADFKHAGTISVGGDAHVTATGGHASAGIGGGYQGDGGAITITDDAYVTATGGDLAAGIGGGFDRIGGTITIEGTAQVHATGGDRGAGIGGGHQGSGGTITVDGHATVDAIGGNDGAGIGGGNAGDGGDITITGDAHVTATGDRDGAGIGGGYHGEGGTITIEGLALVTATGGDHGAGVGGGNGGDGGNVTITEGAHVTAEGGEQAAGIGGGDEGSGGNVTITGAAQVAAEGGDFGAGMGGGDGGGGGDITITDQALVTAVGGRDTSAVGAGRGSQVFGSLELDATLHVPDGELQVPEGADFTIGANGKLLGTETDPTIGAAVTGDGQINNGGVIALDESRVDVNVTDHNYIVTFDAQDGSAPQHIHLFAPNFDVSYRDWTAPPASNAWNTAPDGTGDWFTATTEITTATVLYAVGGFPLLNHQINTCADGDIIALDRDMGGDVLTTNCDVTLDLAGHTLALNHIKVNGDNHLTITDSGGDGELHVADDIGGRAAIAVEGDASLTINGGTITAIGGTSGAGIGSGGLQHAGAINISGTAHVTAHGGHMAAGVGGGPAGNSKSIVISGAANVTAYGGQHGAGLGGGSNGNGGTITIEGAAQVWATGGDEGAGIGGGSGRASGNGGNGAAVTIGGAAEVTVFADATASAIGAGYNGENPGSVQLNSALYVPAGELQVPSGTDFTIGADGKLLGTAADPTTGATITGDGEIDNGGVIALSESLVNVDVTDHNYLVAFDAQDGHAPDHVRVFAPSFEDGHRTLPTTPAATAWNTAADGTGDWFTAATELAGDITVFAATGPATDITLSAPTSIVDQGDSLTFTVTATDVNGNPVNTADAVLTSSVPTDIIDGTTVTFVDASPHIITATLGFAQTSVTIEVTPTAVPNPEPSPAPEPTPTPAPATDGDQLATTGTNPATSGLATLALLLLAAGGALLVIRRTLIH